jgi:hypothetical protein
MPSVCRSFGAEGEFLSAGKKLIDTQHPKFRAVTAVRSRTVNYWKRLSLPYPEAGVLILRFVAASNRRVRRLAEWLAEWLADHCCAPSLISCSTPTHHDASMIGTANGISRMCSLVFGSRCSLTTTGRPRLADV